jgi:hypothetical protein
LGPKLLPCTKVAFSLPNLLHRDQSRFVGHQSCFFLLNVAKLLLVILKLPTVVLKFPIAVKSPPLVVHT